MAVPPLDRDGDEFTTTVRQLPEGAWELYVVGADGELEPVLAGLRDTRALLDAGPPTTGEVRILAPYRSTTGRFGIRAWHRPVHAEVGDLHIGGSSIQITVRFVGRTQAVPLLELRQRGTDVVHTAPVEILGDNRLRFSVPVDALAGDHSAAADTWDLWLCGDPPVRLARLLDDVVDKGTAYVFPELTAGSGHQVRPTYTADNGLSLVVNDPSQ
jgi:hypothetical protein